MPTEIDFPGPNAQGVIVIRMMVIAGVGYGKTSLMKSLSDELAPPERLVIVSPAPGETGQTVLGERLGMQGHVLYGNDKEACQSFFGGLLDAKKSVFLYVDEFDEYCPGGATGATGGYCCEALYRIINYARNKPYEIGVFVSARGTADVTTNAIRAMDVVFFGQMWEGNAIRYLRSCVRGGSIDYEKIVRNLKKFVFMVWCPQAGGFQGFIEVHEDGTWTDWEPPGGAPIAEETPEDADSSEIPPKEPPPTPETPTAPS